MAITLGAGETSVRAQIDAQFGPIDPQLSSADQALIDAARTKLAFSIAQSAVYTQGAAVVNPGIHVSVTGNQNAQTGATDSPGTLS